MNAAIEIPDELYRETEIAPVQRKRVQFPLIASGAPGTLNIPDDAAYQIDLLEDIERYASSM